MGRSFYRCPYWHDKRVDCKFFQWVDEMPELEEGFTVGELRMLNMELRSRLRDCEMDLKSISEKLGNVELRLGYVLMSACFIVVSLDLLLSRNMY
ncbi:hypothetical protein LINGRAHAP2_LOCUS31543 [Linum grandiflorum]